MNLKTFQKWCVSVWDSKRTKGKRAYTIRDLYIMSVGLPGEVGEVLEPMKKAVRDGKPIDKHEMTLELGDVLYYLLVIADYHGISADDLAKENIKKLKARHAKRKKTK